MKRTKYMPIEKRYSNNRIDVYRVFMHYHHYYVVFTFYRMYSIIKIKVKKITSAILFNIVDYYRKMTNEWSGKNVSNVWR